MSKVLVEVEEEVVRKHKSPIWISFDSNGKMIFTPDGKRSSRTTAKDAERYLEQIAAGTKEFELSSFKNMWTIVLNDRKRMRQDQAKNQETISHLRKDNSKTNEMISNLRKQVNEVFDQAIKK